MVKLFIHRRKDGKLRYGIGMRFRILYLFFALILAVGAYAYRNDPDVGMLTFPVILMIILFVAAWYEESWICDEQVRTITYRIGLLFLLKQRIIPFDQIEAFELGLFRKGTRTVKTTVKSRSATRLYRTLSVVLTTGERIDIEILRLKQSAGRTEHAAAVMSSYCGIPLIREDEQEDEE
jgi:hypothetical protein